MIEYTWKIAACDYDAETGAIKTAHWNLSAVQDEYKSYAYGSVGLEADPDNSSFIPYEDVTEETIVNWVKSSMGEEMVLELEVSLQKQIELQITPKTLTGLPWN
jgi:hypothetical protein